LGHDFREETTDGPVSERVRVRRHPERGRYERVAVYAILDEALYCHLGFDVAGQPYVIPTIHARVGDDVYVHGAAASRMLLRLGEGVRVCLTVTLLDGLVLARSVFSHSMNYRSAVVLGTATELTDADDKLAALRAVVERVVPGRWQEARHPTAAELAATRVLRLPLAEASAKVRTGPPKDPANDLVLDVWAGELPLTLRAGRPVAAPDLRSGIAIPEYLLGYRVREPWVS
jgi:uncharacterized protein